MTIGDMALNLVTWLVNLPWYYVITVPLSVVGIVIFIGVVLGVTSKPDDPNDLYRKENKE